MRSTLDAFVAELSDLKVFAQSVVAVYKTLASHSDAVVRACLNVRRRLDYAAFVIALYSVYEKFIEDLAWSFAELESAQTAYPDLFEHLRKKHLHQSAELLARGRLGKGRYTGLTEIDIVENLHACLSGENPYKLNRHAVVYHESNLRSGVVEGIFQKLGIENVNSLACRTAELVNWFCTTKGIETSSTDKVPETVIELRLEDLVDRRNQIAHAGGGLTESFDATEMESRLEFVEAYTRSLFFVVSNVYLDRRYISSRLASDLGVPTEGPLNLHSALLSLGLGVSAQKYDLLLGVSRNKEGNKRS